MASARRRDFPDPPPFEIPTDHVVVEIRADPTRIGGRLVKQDGVESSYVDLADPTHLEFEYLRHLAALVDLTHPRKDPVNVVQIGGGPCVFARYLGATRKAGRTIVIERDAGVIDVAREWLCLSDTPRLEVRIGDGRAELRTLPDASTDVVMIDAFSGIVVPHELLTIEFLDEGTRLLRPGGLWVINLIDIPELGMTRAVVATLTARFEHVLLVADAAVLEHRSSGNVLLVASDRPLPSDMLAAVVRSDTSPWEVLTGRRIERFSSGAAPLRDAVEPDHELARLSPIWGRRS